MYNIKLSTAFTHYQDHLKSLGRKDNSLKLNIYARDYLFEYLAIETGGDHSISAGSGDIDINNLDRFIIRKYLLWLQEEKGVSASTAQRIYDVLNALFHFLVEEELIESSPMDKVEKPKRCPHPIVPLSVDQVQLLLDRCNGKTFTGIRNKLVIALLFDAGLRATELCMVNLDDVDQEQRRILLRHTKTDVPRLAYFSGVVARLMSKYLLVREGMATESTRLIITDEGNPVDRYWLGRMLKRLGGRVGVKVYPHLLRHSCAVESLKNGSDIASVMRLLGHSNPKMSLHYAQLADTDVQEKHRETSPADRLRLSKRK
jgi:integrase/recombinase XerD